MCMFRFVILFLKMFIIVGTAHNYTNAPSPSAARQAGLEAAPKRGAARTRPRTRGIGPWRPEGAPETGRTAAAAKQRGAQFLILLCHKIYLLRSPPQFSITEFTISFFVSSNIDIPGSVYHDPPMLFLITEFSMTTFPV